MLDLNKIENINDWTRKRFNLNLNRLNKYELKITQDHFEQLENPRFWVTFTEEFLSDWKYTCTENKIYRMALPVTADESDNVMDNLRRKGFKYIYLCCRKPKQKKHHYLVFKTREEFSTVFN